MDRMGSIFVKVEQGGVPPNIAAALASAVLEWLLIFLLFVDASFSYSVTKFARYCQLQIPCLMCSRLDHILGKEKDGFYWDLICNGHKLKISSLVLCKHHSKLVDVHDICENCLFSFATVNKSNAETYRLLVGKLGDEPHRQHRPDHDPSLADHSLSTSDERKCACCNEQWISRGHTSRLFWTQSIGYESADFGSPLLATKLHDIDEPDEIRHVPYGEIRTFQTGKRSTDPLPHVEYEKIRMTSDTESEALLSDDDCANVFCVTEQGNENLAADHQEKYLLLDDLASEKLIDPAAFSEPSVIESQLQEEASDLLCAASAPIGDGLEILKQQHVAQKTDFSAASDMTSSCDVLPSSDAIQSSVDESRTELRVVGVADSEKAVKNCSEMMEMTVNSIQTNERQSDMNSGTSDSGSLMSTSLELGDAYKLAVGSRGRQVSGKLLEQKSFKDSTRMSEDLKLLLSQLSTARGIEVLLSDISPRVSGNIDEFRTSDASNSVGKQMLQKRISLERNESGISLDGSIVSEIEGESEVDRLKRQVEHDRKLMGALYKELEEERNASAVAANQAMAMITRLQEEKAALQMEALQLIRMMEEQANFDGEDLQKANDLLAEKEREIQDLEVELEAYKKKIGGLYQKENVVEQKSGLNIEMEPNQTNRSSTQPNASICSSDGNMLDTYEAAKFKDEDTNMKSSSPDFKSEKTLFILQSLRKLEKKLQLFSSDDGASFIPNGENLSAAEKLRTGESEQHTSSNAPLRNGETSQDCLHEHSVLHEGSHFARDESASQYDDNQQLCPGSGEVEHEKLICPDAGSDVLRKEFLLLSGRLEALEAECSFLENSIKSLRKGDEGLKFIQDIACQVRELHAISFKSRN